MTKLKKGKLRCDNMINAHTYNGNCMTVDSFAACGMIEQEFLYALGVHATGMYVAYFPVFPTIVTSIFNALLYKAFFIVSPLATVRVVEYGITVHVHTRRDVAAWRAAGSRRLAALSQ